jgi:hypothetical protein
MGKLMPDYPEGAGLAVLGIFAALALIIISATKGQLSHRRANNRPGVDQEAN